MCLRKNRNSIILATFFSAFVVLSFCSQRQENNQKGVCSNNGDSAVIFTEFVKDTFIFTPIDRLEIPKIDTLASKKNKISVPKYFL